MDHPDRIKGRYIVRFRDDVRDADPIARELAGQHRGKLYGTLRSLNGFWGELPDSALALLLLDPRVRYIEADVALRSNAIGDTAQLNPTGHLDRMDQRALPLNQTYEYSADGTGVHIWIVDVGVDGNTSELAGRISSTMSYATAPLSPFTSCYGQDDGKEMAIIAAGSVSGAARKAIIHSARIDTPGNCNASTGAGSAAIEFIADNSPRPAVISMSLNKDCRGILGCGDTVDDAVEYAHGECPTATTVPALTCSRESNRVTERQVLLPLRPGSLHSFFSFIPALRRLPFLTNSLTRRQSALSLIQVVGPRIDCSTAVRRRSRSAFWARHPLVPTAPAPGIRFGLVANHPTRPNGEGTAP